MKKRMSTWEIVFVSVLAAVTLWAAFGHTATCQDNYLSFAMKYNGSNCQTAYAYAGDKVVAIIIKIFGPDGTPVAMDIRDKNGIPVEFWELKDGKMVCVWANRTDQDCQRERQMSKGEAL